LVNVLEEYVKYSKQEKQKKMPTVERREKKGRELDVEFRKKDGPRGAEMEVKELLDERRRLGNAGREKRL
jgi:hypothetical protein